MRKKQIYGLVTSGAGIFLILYAIHAMRKIAAAKSFIEDTTDFFTHNPIWNPIVTFFGGEAQKKASQYDGIVLFLFILGCILLIGGLIFTVIVSRKNSR